jgi:hypothetical protein
MMLAADDAADVDTTAFKFILVSWLLMMRLLSNTRY